MVFHDTMSQPPTLSEIVGRMYTEINRDIMKLDDMNDSMHFIHQAFAQIIQQYENIIRQKDSEIAELKAKTTINIDNKTLE